MRGALPITQRWRRAAAWVVNGDSSSGRNIEIQHTPPRHGNKEPYTGLMHCVFCRRKTGHCSKTTASCPSLLIHRLLARSPAPGIQRRWRGTEDRQGAGPRAASGLLAAMKTPDGITMPPRPLPSPPDTGCCSPDSLYQTKAAPAAVRPSSGQVSFHEDQCGH